ncbi:adenosine deaminase [Brachybacterium sp. GU-2]|uniref:adenosine deaminase n=1 Tax=Brachybacterium sp. GU-2 TaxID=3069708 RepID=UPI00280B473C|nr:adenosine deaminase [Brachybacterium sp. GU-2]WME22434.1 adenosine deaminase [Brachybacterium sp. GU-2]
MPLPRDLVRSLPKVVLHDHLDGGLRPATVIDLCRELGIDPPGAGAQQVTEQQVPGEQVTEQQVADWFHDAADSGSLPEYLSTFERTVALMQSAAQLRRIAREFVEDMAADGVVYAETRWAPHQHTEGGLSLDEAVQAVQDGLDEGVSAVEARGGRIVVGQLLCYLRHLEPSDDLVEIALARRTDGSRPGAPVGSAGVVGLDLAGPEAGFPASRFRAQFARARAEGLRVTLHAGEGDGPASIADALETGAERLGHGVRLVEDFDGDGGDALGPVAERVHREQICLEVCPSSNLQTGIARTIAEHPVGRLHATGFALALSSDNRLMSRTGTTRETALVAEALDWGVDELEQVALTALASGFAPAAQREALREEGVRPAYAAARRAG